MKRKRVTPNNARILAALREPGAAIVRKNRNAKGQAQEVHVLRTSAGHEVPVHGTMMRTLPETGWIRRAERESEIRYLLTTKGEKAFAKFCLDHKINVFIPSAALLSEGLLDAKQVHMPKKTDSTGKYLTRHGVAELMAGEGNPPINQETVAKYIRLGLPRVAHGKYDADAVLTWFHWHLVGVLRREWLDEHMSKLRIALNSGDQQAILISAASLRSEVRSIQRSSASEKNAELAALSESYLVVLDEVYASCGYAGAARRQTRARQESAVYIAVSPSTQDAEQADESTNRETKRTQSEQNASS